jgi:putative FmdB family regulatory protein
MPTYEYACTSCGQHIEVFQSFSDDPLAECSVCGGQLRKVFHPVGIVFRGSGFYVTDSRKSATKSGGSKGSTEPAESASSSAEKGTDSSRSEQSKIA